VLTIDVVHRVSRLVTSTDPRSRLTWYTYDILNRLSIVVAPLQGLTRFTYDANGSMLFLRGWDALRAGDKTPTAAHRASPDYSRTAVNNPG
jgi:YD repeat-containing protein